MLLFADLMGIVLSVFLAVVIRFGLVKMFLESFKTVTVLSCVMIVTALYTSDLYDIRQDPVDLNVSAAAVLSAGLGTTLVVLSFYSIPRWHLGRGVFLLIFIISSVLIIANRLVWRRFSRSIIRSLGVALVGQGAAQEEAERLVLKHGLRLVPIRGPSPTTIQTEAGHNNGGDLASTSNLEKAIAASSLDAIVMLPSFTPDAQLTRILVGARLNGVALLDFPRFVESVSSNLPVDHLEESWFLTAEGFRLFESSAALKVKRLADLIFSLTMLLLTSPLLPLIAIGIKLSSPGPVLYVQERVGLSEEYFSLIKFRTMKTNSESDAPLWASKKDPRVYPLGALLRRTHLDELPQLLNIIRGEMSFVGPRPERPAFVEKLKQITPLYSLRNCVRPGLTGWAQVNYPYGASEQDAIEKLKFDLFYVRHASLLLDFQIVLKTIPIALTWKGSR